MWIIPRHPRLSRCFPSAPAGRGSTLASLLLSPALSLSAGLSGKRSPWRNWSAASKRASYVRRLFGRTCGPSTGGRGVARWTASWRATRASRSQRPADVVGSQTRGTCGRTSPGWFEKFNRLLCFSKTCQDTSLWGCERSAKTWSGWVTRWRRACSRRAKSARRIAASGCSSSQSKLPACSTPGAMAGGGKSRGQDRTDEPLLPGQAERAVQWMTPDSASPLKPYTRDRGEKGAERATLAGQAQDQWPTPRASENGNDSGSAQRQATGPNPGLKTLAASWATPQARDGNGQAAQASRHRDPARKLAMNLDDQVAAAEPLISESARPTPAARDDRSGQASAETMGRNARPLNEAVEHWPTPTVQDSEQAGSTKAAHVTLCRVSPFFRPAPATATPGSASSPSSRGSPRRRLNPIFVAYLMGWPLTALGISGCSATASCRCAPLGRSSTCGWPSDPATWRERMRAALWRLVSGKAQTLQPS